MNAVWKDSTLTLQWDPIPGNSWKNFFRFFLDRIGKFRIFAASKQKEETT